MGSFKKYNGNPVLGNKATGTIFDPYVSKQGRKLRMDASWRPKKSLVVSFSEDGTIWSEPSVALGPNTDSGWEDNVNRNCVIPSPSGDGYIMWYTGQAHGNSYIGIAVSEDGLTFNRIRKAPVISPEAAFEGESVMNPCVLYENGIYRMWYSAGETYEPNVICYAESPDGITWNKYDKNPIFTNNPEKDYEKDRIGGCQVISDGEGYLMFYIGYRDINTACICAARSHDGITGWRRAPVNPIVAPELSSSWDSDSCYKPTAVENGDKNYMLWYNGRHGGDEYIGLATGMLDL